MIDYIRGTLADLCPTYAVIEAGGVGYELNIALPTYSQLMDKTEAKLFVYEAIRDDAHDLYGFYTKGEREMFMALITVSGVGPNSARTILSGYTAPEIRQLIAIGNAKALSGIKGLGLKTAQKIIVELKDKVLKIDLGDNLGAMDLAAQETAVHSEVYDEAVQALTALGYSAAPAGKVVQKLLAEEPTLTVAQVIKRSLKLI